MINILSKLSMKYVLIAVGVLVLTNGFTFNRWMSARDDVTAAVAQCNKDKETIALESERITRDAVQAAADKRERQLIAELNREIKATKDERQKRLQAEQQAATRDNQLRELEKDAFDEDELPDSNAALNVYLTSCALRSVLHARGQSEAGTGGGGGVQTCGDPGSPDGVHPGFSNVTFGDALRYWGRDRDAALRLNERMAEIRRIQGEVIDEQD